MSRVFFWVKRRCNNLNFQQAAENNFSAKNRDLEDRLLGGVKHQLNAFGVFFGSKKSLQDVLSMGG